MMRHKDDAKHEAIQNAAIELITSVGFEATSMAKIAKAAGVSPATIYVYFENKEDLLNQLYLMVKRDLSDAMLQDFDPEASIAASFKLIWENHLRFIRDEPAHFAFYEQFASSPLVNQISKSESTGYYQPMIEFVERGKREGVFKDVSAKVFFTYAMSPITALAKMQQNDGVLLDEKTLEQAYEMAWDAVTA